MSPSGSWLMLIGFLGFSVSSCDVAERETAEQCLERFKNLGIPTRELRGETFAPIFTYDVSKIDGFLETLADEGHEGLELTFTSNPNTSALNAFYAKKVPPNGAIFGGEGVALYRVHGDEGGRIETIKAGCNGGRDGARLVGIAWTKFPRKDGNYELPYVE